MEKAAEKDSWTKQRLSSPLKPGRNSLGQEAGSTLQKLPISESGGFPDGGLTPAGSLRWEALVMRSKAGHDVPGRADFISGQREPQKGV